MEKEKKQPDRVQRLWKSYRIEILAVMVVLFGIFLLIEPFDIRETLWTWLAQSAVLFQTVQDAFVNWLRSFTLSDFIGLVLVIIVGAFLIWRIRYHAARSDLLNSSVCPNCGSSIIRVHRTFIDLTIEKIVRLNLRRYQCSSELCSWTSLRRKLHEHSSRDSINDELVEDVGEKQKQLSSRRSRS